MSGIHVIGVHSSCRRNLCVILNLQSQMKRAQAIQSKQSNKHRVESNWVHRGWLTIVQKWFSKELTTGEIYAWNTVLVQSRRMSLRGETGPVTESHPQWLDWFIRGAYLQSANYTQRHGATTIALESIISAIAMKCALNLRFGTLAANCIAVPFTSRTYLYELSRGLKACSFPQKKHTIATLQERWNFMENSRCKVVHIFVR
jgi:hypothetical protein